MADAEVYFDQLIEGVTNLDFTQKSYAVVSSMDEGKGFAILPFRDLSDKAKTVWNFADVIDEWRVPAGFNYDSFKAIFHGKTSQAADVDLPEGLKPRNPMPNGCVVQTVVGIVVDSKAKVLRHIILKTSASARQVRAMCIGTPHTFVWRPNTIGARKAICHMLHELGGWRSLHQSVSAKSDSIGEERESAAPQGSNKWNPSEEDLEAGVDFINRFAPVANAKNESYLWIQRHIMLRKDSPIYGWPKSEVKEMVKNKASAKHQADSEDFFPLNIMDLKGVFREQIFPLVVPMLLTSGLFVIGRAGAGKTQLAKIVAMALGRYWIRRRTLLVDGPRFRRGSMMDVFREAPGDLHEAIILDDPSPGVDCIDPEILKNFLDVGENTQCNSRYNPAKFVRNQPRFVICNNWDRESELASWADNVGLPDTPTVTEADLLRMIRPAIGHANSDHKDAILKRSVILVAGFHGAYLRLPSEETDQPVHTFFGDDIGSDWLTEDHKYVLSAYRDGEQTLYEDFGSNVEEEQQLIKDLIETARNRREPTAIAPVSQMGALDHQVLQRLRDEAEAAGQYSFPGPGTQDPSSSSGLRRDAGRASVKEEPNTPPIPAKEEINTPPDESAAAGFGVVDLGYVPASSDEEDSQEYPR